MVEFVGGASSGQVTTVDVVGSDLPQRVRAAAEQILDRQPSLSVLDALDRAAAGAGSTFVAAPPKQRAVIDPMKLILSLDGMVMVPPAPGAKPATAEQVRLLAAEGLRAAGLDVRQAAMLLQGIRWRRARGRSTPAQALALFGVGHDTECKATDAARILARYRSAA